MNGEKERESKVDVMRKRERERQKKMNCTNVRQTSTQLPSLPLNVKLNRKIETFKANLRFLDETFLGNFW